MKKILPLLAMLLLALPLCGKPVSADVNAVAQPFKWTVGSATSATGTLGPFPCANANTGTFTFTTGGGASFTVKTAADGPFSAAYTTDTNFGSSGVIAAPSANSQSSGALGSSAVLYVQATYTGNSGTIAGWFTCSASITAGSSSGGATPIPTPAGGIYPVNVVAPTTGALPTPTAGAAAPSNLVDVNSYPSCNNTSGTAAVTAGNFITLQCDPQGKLYVSLDDPTVTYAKSALAAAATTVLVAGVAGKNIYVYMAAWQSTGTNASNSINWEWSTVASCGSSVTTLFPAAVAPGTATGDWMSGWASSNTQPAVVSGFPGVASRALVLPVGANFCGVTAGTTTAGSFVTYYAIH